MKSGGGRNKLQLETLLADNLSHKRFLSGRWSRKYKRRDFKRTKRTLDLEVYEVNTFWNNFSFLWYFSKLICWIFPQNLRLCMLLDYHNNWILVISAMAQYHIKTNLLPGKHFGVCYRRICCPLEGLEIEERSIFFLEKDFFVLSRAWQDKKRRNRTSDLQIPRSDAIPQRLYSKQGLLRSSYMTRVLHNASLRNGPSSPWNLCGSVVEHQSAESAGLTCDSSKRLRIFPLSHARDMTKKLFSLFLYRA